MTPEGDREGSSGPPLTGSLWTSWSRAFPGVTRARGEGPVHCPARGRARVASCAVTASHVQARQGWNPTPHTPDVLKLRPQTRAVLQQFESPVLGRRGVHSTVHGPRGVCGCGQGGPGRGPAACTPESWSWHSQPRTAVADTQGHTPCFTEHGKQSLSILENKAKRKTLIRSRNSFQMSHQSRWEVWPEGGLSSLGAGRGDPHKGKRGC